MDMEDKVIVTIDREFGSGGHEVAKRVAERLGIPFYDEEIIARAAAKTGYHEEYVRDNDEKAPELSFSNMFSGIDNFQSSPFAKIQEEEFNIIREIASQDNHDGVMIYLEPDILECEVKWALGSITMNKTGGGDGILVELFKIL